mgnify:CR=1 FL=1
MLEAVSNPPSNPAARPTGRTSLEDRFIPVRIEAIVNAIDAHPERFGELSGWARKISHAIDRVITLEVGELHRHLDRLYASANPDLDALAEPNPAWTTIDERLGSALGYLFDRASFIPLTNVGIEEAIAASSAYGLRVRIRPDRIESLAIHVRGRSTVELIKRIRSRPWKRRTIDIEVYTRLAVVARLRGEEGLRLKLFRDIPVADVEALLPHAEATMSAMDRAMVIALAAGSLGSLAKVISTGATSTGALAIPATIGLGGMAIRSFFGYRRKQKLRTAHRTEHLYEKNLANNAAVLHTLCRMIAHEESKTAIVAYAMLAARHDLPEDRRWPMDELPARANSFLHRRFGVTSSFDAPTALETLERLGLMTEPSLADPDRTLATVEAHWKTRDTIAHHVHAISESPTQEPGSTGKERASS